ncbi:MAG: hypothetical protein IRY91_04875 [Gemmatimonadaceae bacterium]|nr:hypothetical protein [Gemmatimonadaceae bacterium]
MNKRCVLLALVIGATACGDGTTGPVPTDQPHFLQTAVGAPPLANPIVSFWASYDHGGEARIVYHALPSAGDSAVLLDFTVPSQSLLERPDGSRLGPGDSVLVTITVIDPIRMVAQFEPSGLRFSAARPAHLTLSLGEIDPDLNADGHVDATDDLLKGELHIWRQEQLGDPWTQLPTQVDLVLGTVAADISGFTNYAVAY